MNDSQFRILKLWIFILTISFQPVNIFAQFLQTKNLVRIDPYSRRSPDTAPFDRTFVIMIPVDSSLKEGNLIQLDLYQQLKNGKKKTILKYDSLQLRRLSRIVDTPKNEGFKYVRVYINRQLPPGIQFGLNLYHSITSDIFENLDKINFKIINGDLSASGDYHDLAKLQAVQFSYGEPIKWPSFYEGDKDTLYSQIASNYREEYVNIFNDRLRKNYQQIIQTDTLIRYNLVSLKNYLSYSPQIILDSLFLCNCRKEIVAKELFSDSTKFLIPLLNIISLDSSILYFAAGKMDIQEFSPHLILSSTQTVKRIKNLRNLKEALLNIGYFFQFSSYASTLPHDTKKKIYNLLLLTIVILEKKIETIVTAFNNIKKELYSDHFFFSGERSYGAAAPVGQDIKTASGNYLIPDVGLTNFGTIVQNQIQYGIRPYIGANISFRPIDKSVPINLVQNKGLIRYSFVIGLTTFQMTRDGTSDLFKNMSLILGLGYRLSRGCRINSGIIIYRNNDTNPVLPQKYTVGPQVSASLDLDIVSWISKLTDKVF